MLKSEKKVMQNAITIPLQALYLRFDPQKEKVRDMLQAYRDNLKSHQHGPKIELRDFSLEWSELVL